MLTDILRRTIRCQSSEPCSSDHWEVPETWCQLNFRGLFGVILQRILKHRRWSMVRKGTSIAVALWQIFHIGAVEMGSTFLSQAFYPTAIPLLKRRQVLTNTKHSDVKLSFLQLNQANPQFLCPRSLSCDDSKPLFDIKHSNTSHIRMITSKQIHKQTSKWMNEWINEWMNEWMKEGRKEGIKEGSKN